MRYNEYMKQTTPFSMRLRPGLRDALKKLAVMDRRSLSNFVDSKLCDVVEQHGLSVCPVCDGHQVDRIDSEGHPEFCDACEGFGYFESKKARLSSTEA